MSNVTRNSDSQVVVWHIGGEGEYGPAQTVLDALAPNVLLVIFEARNDSGDKEHASQLSVDGIPTTVIYKGISSSRGKAPFYVNKNRLSSSLLPPSPLALDENPRYGFCHTWRENSELDYIMEVDTVTLDDILASGAVPPPDIISMDAQGAELRILHGAEKTLEHTLCVVTEVEFFEIYEDQHLFDDQMRFLSHKGFRLLDVYNVQFWHPGPAMGIGFKTVGEAIFIRYACDLKLIEGKRGYVPIDSISDEELLRLIGITMAFNVSGYVFTLAKELRKRNPIMYATLPHLTGCYKVIHRLVDTVEKDWESYKADPMHFRKLKFDWKVAE